MEQFWERATESQGWALEDYLVQRQNVPFLPWPREMPAEPVLFKPPRREFLQLLWQLVPPSYCCDSQEGVFEQTLAVMRETMCHRQAAKGRGVL